MAVKDLVTRDTNIIHLCNKGTDAKLISRETGVDESICDNKDSWYLYNGAWHFYKRFYSFEGFASEEMLFLNELMGEFLANYLIIDSIHYEIAENKGFVGLLSPNFVKPGQEYLFMQDLKIMSQFTNDSNIAKIRKLCKDDNNYRELVSEILKLVAIDMYMAQEDRNFTNIQFTKRNGELHLSPLYDYEDACKDGYNDEYSSALLGLKASEISKYPELGRFLEKLYSLNIGHVLEQIEDERKIIIPSKIKEKYKDFEQERRMVLKM